MSDLGLSVAGWRKSSYSTGQGGACVEVGQAAWHKSSHSNGAGGECVEITDATWRKSSRSGAEGGQCVELADMTPVIAVRDSKDPEGPKLAFARPAFRAFAAGLRAGRHVR